MKQYHKIQTVFKRNPDTNHKTLLIGDYSLNEFAYLKNNKWIFTEKVDGTNIRVMYNDGKVSFGGKTDNAQIQSTLYEYLSETFKSQIMGDTMCLYGEGYGPKIQKGGGLYRDNPSFVLFDVRVGEWWLQRKDVENIAQNAGIDIVPIIGTGTLSEMVELAEKGFDSTWGDFPAEGIVARPEVELKCRNGKRIITKIKLRDFGRTK